MILVNCVVRMVFDGFPFFASFVRVMRPRVREEKPEVRHAWAGAGQKHIVTSKFDFNHVKHVQ